MRRRGSQGPSHHRSRTTAGTHRKREESVFSYQLVTPPLRRAHVPAAPGLEQVVEVIQALAQLPQGHADTQLPGQLQPHLHRLRAREASAPPHPAAARRGVGGGVRALQALCCPLLLAEVKGRSRRVQSLPSTPSTKAGP